ncbi:hypothetical protein D3C76_1414860 [compost metagenome]
MPKFSTSCRVWSAYWNTSVYGGMATSASARLIFSTMMKGSRKNRNNQKNGTPITACRPLGRRFMTEESFMIAVPLPRRRTS